MNDLFYQLYETSVNMIKAIDELSILNGLEDSQEYLNFKDELNSISIDRDRN